MKLEMFKWPAIILSGATLMHTLAYFALGNQVISLVLLICVGLATFALSYKNLSWGLLLAFFELFIGGHGILLVAGVAGFSLSLRMVIFAAVLGAWLILMIQRKVSVQYVHIRDYPWVVFAAAVFAASVIGLIANPLSFAFDDANSYLFALYLLPIISVPVTSIWKKQLLGTLAIAGVWIAFSGVLLSYLFTHLSLDAIDALYTFVRDARLYEVTLQVIEKSDGPMKIFGDLAAGSLDYWYRIFGQSQIIALFGGLLALSWTLFQSKRLGRFWPVAAVIGACVFLLLIGFSRTFILTGAIGALLVVTAFIFTRSFKTSLVVKRLIFVGVASLLAFGVLAGSLRIKIPQQTTLAELALRDRDTSRDAAVASRWNLALPMLEEIKRSPFVGYGFGKTVTYVSEDPRVIEETGDGVYETYRFEWGYLDLWMKTGILGLVTIALLLWSYTRVAWFHYKKHPHQWLTVGLYASFITLLLVHVLTPYLNHPIGLGWLLFLVPFFDFEGLQSTQSKAPSRRAHS